MRDVRRRREIDSLEAVSFGPEFDEAIDEAPPIHSRYRKDFRRSLPAELVIIRDHRIPRHSLLSVRRSPWRKILDTRSAQSLIAVTGLDIDALHYLFEKFAPLFDNNSPFLSGTIEPIRPNFGRPRKIRHEDCVGLVLMWTRTRGSLMTLQMIFGMTMTNLAMYLKFGKRLLVEILRNDKHARIRIPTAAKIEEYRKAVGERHPCLDDVWVTMDGLKLDLEQAPLEDTQNRFYNGWTHGHYVSSVFCFAPNGTIPIAFFNIPGCVHDSQIADWGRVYEKLARVYDVTGAKCTVDSAFAAANHPYLVKSSQDYMVSNEPTLVGRRRDILRKRAATSMRQSAEWGMRGLQGSFPRLRDRIKYEDRGERRINIKMMTLLFNLRSNLVGINQIKSVYMPILESDQLDAMMHSYEM